MEIKSTEGPDKVKAHPLRCAFSLGTTDAGEEKLLTPNLESRRCRSGIVAQMGLPVRITCQLS